jgi:D-alanyl-lipoteichoic acid acyltransferase DltB (MBOAT superfamily)
VTFVQIEFAYFLAIVFGLWILVRDRYVLSVSLLLTASLVFYGFRQWWVLSIILSYCLVDWLTGLWLARTGHRRLALASGVAFNLGVLCFWKYTPLLLDTGATLFGWPALRLEPVASGNWVIPMGISFYAFTGIAYMVDVYRRHMEAETNFWRYALFTAFFPHLVAGPILRPREFLIHLRPGSMPVRPLAMGEGTFLIGRGLFKKLVLADSIALAIDPFFAHVSGPSTAGVWSLPYIYLYALQIYFDFSGYTDIARGLGLWFGFRWPENFNWPYLATSIQDFWRRWHMTLSRFLRDYLYIPLGGNRGAPWRVAAALMITMLLGGLWHGASWSFMLWGGLHGLFLAINRWWGTTALHDRLAAQTGAAALAWRWLRVVLTFNAVCLAWCFFRLTHLPDSLACVRKWIDFDLDKAFAGGSGDPALWVLLACYGAATLAAHLLTRRAPLPEAAARMNAQPLASGVLWGVSLGLLALALLLTPGGQIQPFIYFQF